MNISKIEMSYRPSYVLKHMPEDFQVNECYVIPLHLPHKEDLNFLILQKSGFTTFDAVHHCAEFFGLPKKSISYFGLKDEHAITQQLLCIQIADGSTFKQVLEKFNQAFYFSNNSYIKLIYLQNSPHHLTIGGLLSNAFFLTIRMLSSTIAQKFTTKKNIELTFINYYGTQRFGLPGEISNTHIIGSHLLEGNFEPALEKIKLQKSTLGETAARFCGEARDFFSSIDNRERNFFINSHYSFIWNEHIKARLINENPGLTKYDENGISYLFPHASLPANFRHISQGIVQYKTVAGNTDIKIQPFNRPLFVQVFFNVISVDEDEVFPGYFKLTVSFNLPTGTYATMAILQLLLYMEHDLL